MIALLLSALLAGTPVAPPPSLAPGPVTQPAPPVPTDTFRRYAVEALAGKHGHLDEWQRSGYQIGLARGVTSGAKRTCLTSYGCWEAPLVDSLWAAQDLPNGHRRRLDATMCAADKGVPFGTVVWANGELRVVRDRGSGVTLRRARSADRRNTRNLDFWTRKCDEHSLESTPYAVVCTDADIHRWTPTPGAVVPQ